MMSQSSQPKRGSTLQSKDNSTHILVGDDVGSSSGNEEISSENCRLEDRKRAICDEMRMRMEDRRKEWNVEMEKLRRDFFHQRSLPPETSIAPPSVTENARQETRSLDRARASPADSDDDVTNNRFVVSFDLSSFLPNEILVRTEDRKLIISARHEDKSPDGKRTATRTFNRQIDIPRNVDSRSMRCTLTKHGELHLEANTVARRSFLEFPVTPGGVTTTPRVTHLPSVVAHDVKTVDPKLFSISVNIGMDFLPEDLSIKTVDQKLIVSARRELEQSGNTSMKEFYREFDLPDTVDPGTVTASMTEGGYLLIEATFQGQRSPSIKTSSLSSVESG